MPACGLPSAAWRAVAHALVAACSMHLVVHAALLATLRKSWPTSLSCHACAFPYACMSLLYGRVASHGIVTCAGSERCS